MNQDNQGPDVLVIDDNKGVRQAITAYLTASKFTTEVLDHSSLTPLEIAEAINRSVAKVVVIDGTVVGGTAIDVLRHLPDSRKGVVVVTGSNDIAEAVKNSHPAVPVIIKTEKDALGNLVKAIRGFYTEVHAD